MSEKTTKDPIEDFIKKYHDFWNALENVISETKKSMENIDQMSQQVHLYPELDEERKKVNLSVNIHGLEGTKDGIAKAVHEVKNTAYKVRDIEGKVAKLVIHQAEDARQNTESAIDMAKKISGSN